MYGDLSGVFGIGGWVIVSVIARYEAIQEYKKTESPFGDSSIDLMVI